MNEIKKLMSKKLGYEIDEKKLKEIKLFPFVNLNSFQRFLLDSRVLPFMRMIILDKFKEKNFIVGFEETKFCSIDDDEYEGVEIEPLGSNIVDDIFEGSELFENEAAMLGLEQLDANELFFSLYPRIEESGDVVLDIPEDEFEWIEDEGKTMISTDGTLVLLKDKVYCDKDLDDFLEKYRIYFQTFLNNSAKATSVDHNHYIDLLMKLFPGKIKVKSLSA